MFATLDCHHEVYISSRDFKIGDDVWCRLCRVVRCITYCIQWHVKCMTCKYGKSFGAAELTCRVNATRHNQSNPTHVVQVLYGDVIKEIRNPIHYQRPLPFDQPPF